MPIKYLCPNCRQVLSISRKQTGKEFPCPKCGVRTRVPTIPVESETGGDDASHPRLTAIHPQQTNTAKVAIGAVEASGQTDLTRDLREASTGVPAKEKIRPESSLQERQTERPSPTQMVLSAEVGRFRIRRRAMSDDGMDLTPMVDVTFLLLIFFMITASFSLQKTLEFPKPNPEDKGARQTITLENLQNDSIMIKIDERNGVTVDEQPLSDPGLLTEQLTQLRYSTRRTSVAIDADKDAFHQSVVSVIDASNAAGMENIKLISRSNGK